MTAYERLTKEVRESEEFIARQKNALKLFKSSDPFSELTKFALRPALIDSVRFFDNFPKDSLSETQVAKLNELHSNLLDLNGEVKHSSQLVRGIFNPEMKWTSKEVDPKTGRRETFNALNANPYVIDEFYLAARAVLKGSIDWLANAKGLIESTDTNSVNHFIARELRNMARRNEMVATFKVKLAFIEHVEKV